MTWRAAVLLNARSCVRRRNRNIWTNNFCFVRIKWCSWCRNSHERNILMHCTRERYFTRSVLEEWNGLSVIFVQNRKQPCTRTMASTAKQCLHRGAHQIPYSPAFGWDVYLWISSFHDIKSSLFARYFRFGLRSTLPTSTITSIKIRTETNLFWSCVVGFADRELTPIETFTLAEQSMRVRDVISK